MSHHTTYERVRMVGQRRTNKPTTLNVADGRDVAQHSTVFCYIQTGVSFRSSTSDDGVCHQGSLALFIGSIHRRFSVAFSAQAGVFFLFPFLFFFFYFSFSFFNSGVMESSWIIANLLHRGLMKLMRFCFHWEGGLITEICLQRLFLHLKRQEHSSLWNVNQTCFFLFAHNVPPRHN